MAAATGAIARRRHLRIERLEERALLSGVSYTLTTNQSTYQAGQPIQITLTGTNTTNQTIQTIAGPDLDNFVVTENGVAIWDSELVELPLAYLATLQPGRILDRDGHVGRGAELGSVERSRGRLVHGHERSPEQRRSPPASRLIRPCRTTS